MVYPFDYRKFFNKEILKLSKIDRKCTGQLILLNGDPSEYKIHKLFLVLSRDIFSNSVRSNEERNAFIFYFNLILANDDP